MENSTADLLNPCSLELPEDQMRDLTNLAMGHIMKLLTTLCDQPMDGTGAATPEFLHSMIEPLPETPSDAGELLDHLFTDLAPKSVNTISGGFMAYIGCGGLFESAVADLISNSLNRYTGSVSVAPTLCQIESNVIRWFCSIVGFPKESGGFLCSGGSQANLSAVITARQIKLGKDFSRGTIYISDQAHHCVEKAAHLAGFPRNNLRVLRADADFRLNPSDVKREIEEDRENGMKPFLLVASAGTTNSGAVDPLLDCAVLARSEDLWFHVDGAYGGFFMMTERGRQILKGIEMADSLVLDPHKTLFLPYGTGALVVRDRETLLETHQQKADYLLPSNTAGGLMDFSEMSPELTKPFRGLRVWLPLKIHGAAVFRELLDERLDLGRWAENQLRQITAIEVLTGAQLSVVTFAARDTGQSLEERNEHSRRILAGINSKQRVFLSGTLLDGLYAIRVAVVSFRTHLEHLEMLIEDLKSTLDDLGLE
jgi:aromatic-L-amino-acid decarboxylase